MDNLVFSHQIKRFAFYGVGLVVAIFVGANIGSANYVQLILGGAAVAVIGIGLFSSRFLWVVTVASSFLAGTFPILGGSFTPFQILMTIGVVRFVIEDIVLRRTRMSFGNRIDLLLLAGFMGVLTVHAIHDRFGMRFLGSTVWGGRNYVNVYVGLAAFFVVQSIPMKSRLWAKLPYVVIAVAFFDVAIAIVTTVFPNTIYAIYPFYSAVSRTAIEEVVTGTHVETARLASVGNFGVMLIAAVLSANSIRRMLKPPILGRLVVLSVGFLAVLLSSFRTAVFNALTVTLLAGFRDLKFRVLLLLPVVAALLLGLSFLNSQIRIPKEIQRSLTFLPGDWDNDVVLDADSSNNFRKEVWTLWADEFFPLHPWLGRGFGFRSEWAQRSVFKTDPNEYRQMVEVGSVHNGFLAAMDCLGIIGTTFFIIWNVRLLAQTFRVSFRGDNPDGMALRFLALCLGSSIIAYWMGAADVGSFLPQEFALAGVFLRLQRSSDSKAASAPAATESSLQEDLIRA